MIVVVQPPRRPCEPPKNYFTCPDPCRKVADDDIDIELTCSEANRPRKLLSNCSNHAGSPRYVWTDSQSPAFWFTSQKVAPLFRSPDVRPSAFRFAAVISSFFRFCFVSYWAHWTELNWTKLCRVLGSEPDLKMQTRCRQSGNSIGNYKGSSTWSKNIMNFGSQTPKIRTEVFTHPLYG